MNLSPKTITVYRGVGIGPEIVDATLEILEAAGANFTYEFIEIGLEQYRRGYESGIPPEAWEIIRSNRVFLKGPVITPQGSGMKSLTVTLRNALGVFANIRPVRSFTPFVPSHFPQMDLVVIRENSEELYTGIEYQQTPEMVQSLKLVSWPASERIIRYAFEFARAFGRRKVTCMTKDNILKQTDGLFHRVFTQIARQYEDIEAEHLIIDIGAALVAHQPERFDVIVTLNLYGDILSDITAQLTGSVGLGGSANIGHRYAMFEAVHGSAPDIAGKGIANPSGIINAAGMLLNHIGAPELAAKIQNALLKTLEDGIHTRDINYPPHTKHAVDTKTFVHAIIERLGEEPAFLRPILPTAPMGQIQVIPSYPERQIKSLVGVDIFIDWNDRGRAPDKLGQGLEAISGELFDLEWISNRGTIVYPNRSPEVFLTDHWQCRFLARGNAIAYSHVIDLLRRLDEQAYSVIKTENLYNFGGRRSYSLAHSS